MHQPMECSGPCSVQASVRQLVPWLKACRQGHVGCHILCERQAPCNMHKGIVHIFRQTLFAAVSALARVDSGADASTTQQRMTCQRVLHA